MFKNSYLIRFLQKNELYLLIGLFSVENAVVLHDWGGMQSSLSRFFFIVLKRIAPIYIRNDSLEGMGNR